MDLQEELPHLKNGPARLADLAAGAEHSRGTLLSSTVQYVADPRAPAAAAAAAVAPEPAASAPRPSASAAGASTALGGCLESEAPGAWPGVRCGETAKAVNRYSQYTTKPGKLEAGRHPGLVYLFSDGCMFWYHEPMASPEVNLQHARQATREERKRERSGRPWSGVIRRRRPGDQLTKDSPAPVDGQAAGG